jgi:uncharacterized membrane protein YdjX (TVP38/TMEM64 family)
MHRLRNRWSNPVMQSPVPQGSLPAPARPASAGHALLFATRRIPRRAWWMAAVGLALAAAAAAAVLLFVDIDWGGIMDRISSLPAIPLLAAMALLPLVGFPVLPVYLVAGARFGPYGGGAVVAFATAVHVIGSYVIARTVLRGPLERLLSKWHAHLPAIPRDEEVAVAFIAALVPGIPYAVRNYLYAIIGLRLRVCFWIAVPIDVARAYVSILLGNAGNDPSGRRLFILGGVEVLKVVICAVTIAWLRRHHRRAHPEPAPASPPQPNA